MKKLQIVLLALFAVVALSAVVVASASAEETLLAEWLVGIGNPVAELLSAETAGQLTLEDTKTLAGAAAVLCSAILDGSVGPNGEDEVTEVLNLKKEKVELGVLALLGTGAGSDCVTVKICSEGTATSPIEVWPEGLPWHTTLFLMAEGKFLDLVTGSNAGGKFGYTLLCLVAGLNTEDTCESADSEYEVINDADTGDASVPAGQTITGATCTMSGAATGVQIIDELTPILLLNLELLTVSSV
jgi:hypothetical protein